MKNNKLKFDVIILCGGKGERMRPLTVKTPKPLTLIKKKPFIEYLIKFFLKKKFNNIIIACGYKSHLFKKFVNDKYHSNKKIKIIDSGLVDIIQRLKDSENLIQNNFFVCYGDSFALIDYNKYVNFFLKNKNYSTMITSFYKLQFGTLKVDNKNKFVLRFNEKPKLKEPINIGYFIFKKEIFSFLKKFQSWESFLKGLIKRKKLKFFNFNGFHLTFNDYGELQVAKSKIKEINNFLKSK